MTDGLSFDPAVPTSKKFAGVGQIDASLATLAVPVAGVLPHPENYRRGDVEAIAESLQRFGQVRPLVVQASTRTIVAGNHTYAAAIRLGWTHVAAAFVDLSDEEARAYLVADNRLSDKAENDDAALAKILDDLDEQGKLSGTGFDHENVGELLRSLAKIPDPIPPADPDEPPAADRVDRKAGAGPMPHREFVLVLTTEQADRFERDLKRLSKHYDTTGTAPTVLAAIAVAVKAANAK